MKTDPALAVAEFAGDQVDPVMTTDAGDRPRAAECRTTTGLFPVDTARADRWWQDPGAVAAPIRIQNTAMHPPFNDAAQVTGGGLDQERCGDGDLATVR